MEKLPSQFLIRHLLSYDADTGSLKWLPREPSMFMNSAQSSTHQAKRWNTDYAGQEAGTLGANGYVYISLEGSRPLAHRVIWKLIFNTEPEQIDHINGDRSDNRLANLRAVTKLQNAQNMRRSRRNTSGSTGVSYRKDKRKWRAYIHVDGRIINLGHFLTRDEAIAARETASEKYGYHANHGR